MAAGTELQKRHIAGFQVRFLQVRGYEKPTGEPLYSYRMSPQEFTELDSGLREFFEHHSKYALLSEIVRAKPWLPALFVLYSAEWWRREYNGSSWSWGPILLSLGAAPDGWTESQRSHCVEVGLAQWRIGLSQSRGFRFLGSIALQGGLPMKLLAAAQGNIGRVLSRVLLLAATSHVGEPEIEEWIRSLSSYLPFTYRQSEIFRLLTQVITTVLALKARAGLTSADVAVAELDRVDPQWRHRFPLPVDDNQARGLIEQLVRDAASVRVNHPPTLAMVDRRLEAQRDNWQLRSDVVLPEYLDVRGINALFGYPKEASLPRSIVLRFGEGARSVEMAARRLAGRDTYRIDRKLPEFRDTDAAAEHLLSMISPDGVVKTVTLRKGDELDTELPWLFEDPSGGSAKFVRQGSGSVSTPCGVICVSSGWSFEQQPDGDVETLGEITALARDLWRFKGSVRISDRSGTIFRFRSGQASTDDEQLGWSGARALDVLFSSPSLAFRGNPKLCHFSLDGNSRTVSSVLSWKIGSAKKLSPAELVGPVEATWPATGDTQWRSRLVLLGGAKSVVAEPGETPNQGKLIFADWKLASAISKTEYVSLVTQNLDDSLSVEFRYDGPGSPPEWCDIDLLWRGNPSRGEVRVPFPAWGARCFDSKGRELAQDSIISTDNAFGVRLLAFVGRTDRAVLRLTLWEGKTQGDTNAIDLNPQTGSYRVELRLVDYLTRIQRMLASADSLSAYVRVELQAGSSRTTSLRVGRYSCELIKIAQPPSVCLPEEVTSDMKAEDVAEINTMAIRLSAPNEEPVRLSRLEEGVRVAWHFPIEELEPGPWLIYPQPRSPILFRPMLWTIGSRESTEVTWESIDPGLPQIMCILDPEVRCNALENAIERLAADFQHVDWRALEQLAQELWHLPLCTLDVWRVFSRTPKGLASLALRATDLPAGFLERFSSELPSIWETVGLRMWVDAMKAYIGYHKANPTGTPPLKKRIEVITSLHSSLWVLLEVAESLATGVATQGVRVAMTGQIDFYKRLFAGEDCPFQSLLRETADATWPIDLRDEIAQARVTPALKFFRFADPYYRDIVVNIPILLAVSAAAGFPLKWVDTGKLRSLRKYQDFCPEWFAEAFDLTVARCIAEGAIQGLGS